MVRSCLLLSAQLLIPLYLVLGDIMHLDLLGQSMIVLGSMQSASDLMEKRSNNYSDRPSSVMVDLYVLFCNTGRDTCYLASRC